MIDINELRRLAQAASHPTTKGRWIRLFGERTVYDRMEDGCRGIPVVSTDKHPPSSFEAACLDFIAAANPAVINSLLERLEAAESDALEQARLNGMGSEREAALMAKLEAAEKERDDVAQQLVQSEVGKREISEAHDALQVEVGKLKDLEVSRCVKINGYIVDNARLAEEVVRLRAKIAEMEKQEPVGWIYTVNGGWDCYSPMKPTKDAYDTGSLMPRYALPGAQAHPAPSVPDDGFRRGVECAVAFVARKAELYLIRFGDDDARRHVLSVLVDELCGLFKVQPAPSAPEVTDAMALAFHSALTDGSIGEHELEEIKVGLRAALAAAPEAKP